MEANDDVDMPDALPADAPALPQYDVITFAPDSNTGAAPKPIEDTAWEDELMHTILKNEKAVLSAGLPPIASSMAKTDKPPLMVPAMMLPLSLAAPERTHPSALPGVNVTHPHGALQGGGTAYSKSSLRADVADILDVDSLRKRSELVRRVQSDITKTRADMVRAAKARKDLLDHNARVKEQLRQLDKEREEELAFETRWRKEREEKVKRRQLQGQAEAARVKRG